MRTFQVSKDIRYYVLYSIRFLSPHLNENFFKGMANTVKLQLLKPNNAEYRYTCPRDIPWKYDFTSKDCIIILDRNNLPDSIMFTSWYDNGDALYGHLTEYSFEIPKGDELIDNMVLRPSTYYHKSIAEETRESARNW